MDRIRRIFLIVTSVAMFSACSGGYSGEPAGAGAYVLDRTPSVELPPLPEAAASVGDLAGELDDLPITGLDDLPLFDAATARDAFVATWATLSVAPADAATIAAAGDALLAASVDRDGLDAAVEALAAEPRNTARLVDAAVSLFWLGVANTYGAAVLPPDGSEFDDGYYEVFLQAAAVDLLRAVERHFPTDRAVLLDLAYFTSVTDPATGIDDAEALVASAVERDPDDMTALAFLASLQARRPADSDGYRAAGATLDHLADGDPLTAALRGDALLSAAALRQVDAPRTAQVLAERAAAAYDDAIGSTRDPGLYAGRARAAAILGDHEASIEAWTMAVDLAPRSVPFLIGLAAANERSGQPGRMGDAARRALAVVAAPSWEPTLATSRLVLAPNAALQGFVAPGDVGWLGASIGSGRETAGVVRTPQGGAFVASRDVVTAVADPVLDDWRRLGFAPDVAASMAIEAATATGDLDGATEAWVSWDRDVYANPRLAGNGAEDSARTDRIDYGLQGAELVATDDVSRDLTPTPGDPTVAMVRAERALRRIGNFDDLAGVCRAAAALDADAVEAARCEGDALLLSGDPAAAAERYAEVSAESGGAALSVREAAAWLGAGEPEPAAAALRRAVVASTDPAALGPIALLAGQAALDSGQPAVARAHLDLAVEAFDALDLDPNDHAGITTRRALLARAHNTRGVVAVRLTEPDLARPPDCTGPRRAECRAAIADFEAALVVDPFDAVALMNRAWVERATGRTDAARRTLTAAVDVDSTLYPALNDLAVLEARAGDTGAARSALRAALDVEPGYALAEWNLGVLEMRSGITGAVAGQRHLARATDLDGSLGSADLELRTDERVYEVSAGGLDVASDDWAVGRPYGLAATALGAVALVSALGRFRQSTVGDAWERGVAFGTERWKKHPIVEALATAARRVPERLPPGARPWVPWLGTTTALGAVGLWTTWRQEPRAVAASVAVLVVATAAALAVHELAHVRAARRRGGRLRAAQWTPGVVLAVLLAPAGVSAGPYFAERFDGISDDQAWRVHLAGPVANLVAAAATFAVHAFWPAPALVLATQVQLAVCGYSLLPSVPLDGKPIAEKRPLVAAALGLVVAAASAALVF